MGNKFSLKLFSGLALAAGLCACGESSRDTAGGVSEETEGIYAIENKTIAGVSQKGPFVTGSDVYLMETKADSSLEPTGKKFYAMIRNDKGEFTIEDISLESPFVLLTVEGYYTREFSDEISPCQVQLNAVSNIEKRDMVNINLLTHLEHQRVLKLLDSGLSFDEAKKQASKEVLKVFGFESTKNSTEDLNLTKKGDDDKALLFISAMLDYQNEAAKIQENNENICQKIQENFDFFANDLADDGSLNDSSTQLMAGFAYDYYDFISGYMENPSNEYKQTNEFTNMKSELKKFSYSLFEKYAGLKSCTMDNWGELQEYPKNLGGMKKTNHLLCTGYNWQFITKAEYEKFNKKLDHEIGSMTDPRDGKTYRTVSFSVGDRNYEWMGEKLMFSPDTLPRYAPRAYDSVLLNEGEYTWNEALGVDPIYYDKGSDNEEFIDPAQELKDSIQQGICPEGWHIPASWEWNALLKYVGGPEGLYSRKWISSQTLPTIYNKRYQVYFDKIEFQMEPTITTNIFDKTSDTLTYIKADFHTYTLNKDYVGKFEITYSHEMDLNTSNYQPDYFYISFNNNSFREYRAQIDIKPIAQAVASVRCVKN